MKKGHLSQYFSGVAAKRLSAVEAHPERSHQHEFNGSDELIRLLGAAGGDKHRHPARFIYVDGNGDEPVIDDSTVTWYDARARSAARTGRSEHRLYFPANAASEHANEGDLLLIAKPQDGTLLIIIAADESTIARQLHWLFGLPDLGDPGFSVRDEFDSERDRLGLAASMVLEQIGVDTDLSDETYLDAMLARFGAGFPGMRDFSAYARETLGDLNPAADPDGTVVAWMEREEVLFRTLEKHLLGDRLRQGFMLDGKPDVEGFVSFSLSVQNRRKTRAGAALENHLERVFTSLSIRHARGAVTERNNRPDFLFPGAAEYHDPSFAENRLTMLAAKTSAKDRWRQVTKEADRIALKHLLTLEPAISEKQTDQMRQSGVQLVVPAAIHGDYTPAQCQWLVDVRCFVALLRERE